MGQVKWATEEAARNHHYRMMFVAIAIIAVAVIFYYNLASTRLTNRGSIYKNLFSVSIIAILGFCFWANAFNIDRIGPSNRLLNSHLWENYAIFNGYSFFFISEAEVNNAYIFLLFSFIPTIAMWIGMNRKKIRLH